MQVSVTIAPKTINLGETVTVTYTSSGSDDTQLNADNLFNPIDLGGGDISGSIKLLPVTSGSFNVSIVGSAMNNGSGTIMNLQSTDSCTVN
jgi:hypothetical protein